jgi:hypothetical protein
MSVPLGAWLLGRVLGRLGEPGSLSPGRVLARALLLALFAIGPGRALAAALHQGVVELRAQVPITKSEADPTFHGAFRWIAQQRAADPDPTPWRVAYLTRTTRQHAWAEGLRTGVPVVDFVNISTNFLAMRPRERSLAGFADWNIRFAILEGIDPPFAGMALRFTSGRYRIFEVSSFDSRFVVGPTGVEVSGLRFAGDEVRFEVRGAPAGGAELQVRTAHHPRWRAWQGGRSLAVQATSPRLDAKPRQDQLRVVASDGEVVLRCDGAMPGLGAGVALSLLGLATLVLGASARRRRWLERSSEALADRLRPRRHVIALGACAVVAIAVLPGARRTPNVLLPPALEGRGLEVSVLRPAGWIPCQAAWWRAAYLCPNKEEGLAPAAVVDGWIGRGARPDDTEEHGQPWPATRVAFSSAAVEVELRFLAPAGRRLVLDLVATGATHVSVIGPAGPLLERAVGGEPVHVELPWPPGARELVVQARSRSLKPELMIGAVID